MVTCLPALHNASCGASLSDSYGIHIPGIFTFVMKNILQEMHSAKISIPGVTDFKYKYI